MLILIPDLSTLREGIVRNTGYILYIRWYIRATFENNLKKKQIFRENFVFSEFSELRFGFYEKFYIDYRGFHIYFFFFHVSVVKETKMQKIAKKPCFGQFEVQTSLERLLSYLSKKTYLNNFQNTISHVKFLEEFESFIRIQVRVKALPKNGWT